ncbi:nucleotidyltransferase family protein [Abiotrophia defectiva]
MALIGILAEYNPLHRGHAYQLDWAKRHFPQDQILVLMSGNVVQRGEFAIIDKWHRAQAAVDAGADLVIELPTLASLQSADYFGRHGMAILAKLGVERIVFGTESAQIAQLKDFLAWEKQHQAHIDKGIQDALKTGLAYPAAYQVAIQSLADWSELGPWQANHQLGLQYLKTLARLAPDCQVLSLPRLQETGDGQPILSGSAIRQAFRHGQEVAADLAPGIQGQLSPDLDAPWSAYWPYLRYQLLTQPLASLEQIAGVKEGLANRLKSQAETKEKWEDWRQAMISKRWTQAAIQRVAMAILLQIPQTAVTAFNQGSTPQAFRLLDASQAGRPWLSAWRKREDLSVFSHYKPDYEGDYGWNLAADAIYQLRPGGQIQSQVQPKQVLSFLR